LGKGSESDARLLNLEFHRQIAQASENPVIFFIIDSIMNIMERNISSILLLRKPLLKSLEYHEKIYSAMRGNNAKAAHDLMYEHIMDIQATLETVDKGSVQRNN
jgi:GntR family transcriptional repressor for pyruvate dehydrogenase complex